MLKKIINQTNYDHSTFAGDWQAPQTPDHVKCGEVFTWLCAGELYAVECKLCEDCPLCPLSEFAQHMDIWHTDWQITTPKHEINNVQLHFTDDDDDDEEEHQQNAVTNNNDFKSDHELQNDTVTSQQQAEEILQPFEQVLIEQDISIHTIHIDENANEEEHVEDANLPAADNKQYQIENKQKLPVNINPIVEFIINEQRAETFKVTESERELQCLTENETELNVSVTKDLGNKRKYFKFPIKPRNNNKGKKAWQQRRNYRQNLRNFNNKIQTTSDSETHDAQNLETQNIFNDSGKITKSLQQNLTKIEKIKRSLNKIVRNLNNLRNSVETKTETSGNETINKRNEKYYQKATNLKNFRSNYLRNRKNILRNCNKFEKEVTKKEIGKATSERVKETHQMANKTIQIAGPRCARDKETTEIEKATFQSLNGKFKFKSTKNNVGRMQRSVKIKTNNLNQNRLCAEKLMNKTINNKSHTSATEPDNPGTSGIETENQIIENIMESKPALNGNDPIDIMPTSTKETREHCNKLCVYGSETEPNELETKLQDKEKQTKIDNKSQHNKNKRKSSAARQKNKTGTHGNETLCEQEDITSESKVSDHKYLIFDECMKKSLETRKRAENYLQETAKSPKILQHSEMKANETPVTENSAKETREHEIENLNLQKFVKAKGNSENRRMSNENEIIIKEHQNLVNEIESEAAVVGTNATETNYAAYLKCLQRSSESRKKVEKFLKKNIKAKVRAKDNEKHIKPTMKRHEKETQEIENKEHDKPSISGEAQNLQKSRKSLRILSKNFELLNEKKLQIQGKNENKRTGCKDEEGVKQISAAKALHHNRERERSEIKQQDKGKLIKIETNNGEKLRKNIFQRSTISKELKKKRLTEASKVNEYKRKLRNYEKERKDSPKRLKTCSSNRIKKRKHTHWKRCTIKKPLKEKTYYSKNHFNTGRATTRSKKTRRRVIAEKFITSSLLKNSSTNFGIKSESSEISPCLANESEMTTLCHEEKQELSLFKESNKQAKEKVNEVVSQKEQQTLLSSSPQEDNGNGAKQTLVKQFFYNKESKQKGIPTSSKTSEKVENNSGRGTSHVGDSYSLQNSERLQHAVTHCGQLSLQESFSGRATQNQGDKLEHQSNLEQSSASNRSCTTLSKQQERNSRSSRNLHKLECTNTSDQRILQNFDSSRVTQFKEGLRISDHSNKLKHTATCEQLNLDDSPSDICTTLKTQQEGVSRSSENSHKLHRTSTSDYNSFSSSGKNTPDEKASKNSNTFEKLNHATTSDETILLESCSGKDICTAPNVEQEGGPGGSTDQLNLHESFSSKRSCTILSLQQEMTLRNLENSQQLKHDSTQQLKKASQNSENSKKLKQKAISNELKWQKSSSVGICLSSQREKMSKASENSEKLQYKTTSDQLNMPESCCSQDNLTTRNKQQEKTPSSSELEHIMTSDHYNLSYSENSIQQQEGASKNSENSKKLGQTSTSNQHKFPESSSKTSKNSKTCHKLESSSSRDSCCTTPTTEPSSPLSPKTEEEHFEFYERNEKLNKQHISHLIKLYREHPRLWDQSHPEFCEPQVCRKSWHSITEQWNELCKRKFTIAEVRIRICTLCQRFLQERDRLASEGEVDECAKFPYYEELQFLEQHKSLQKRRELYDQQNEKILEIYQYFPALWHVSFYKATRKTMEREQAIESISKAIKLFDINLSSVAIQKRLRSLRKCYRLEKIRHLHAQVEQTAFECKFRHYETMHFLDKHIDPFVCRICGKIFENLPGFRLHLKADGHGSVLMEDGSDDRIVEEDGANAKNTELNINQETCFAPMQESNFGETETDAFAFSPITNSMKTFSDSEDSKDILQRFTPFSCSPVPIGTSITSSHQQESVTPSFSTQEVVYFPLDSSNEPVINSLHLEEQLIGEIMENVNNNNILSQQGLDQFINTVTSCEGSLDFELTTKNCIIDEDLRANLIHAENSFVVEHPDIVADQSPNNLNLSPMAKSFTPLQLYTENSFIIEHPDIVTDQNVCFLNEETIVETVAAELLHAENAAAVQHDNLALDDVIEMVVDEPLEASSPYRSVQEMCSFNDLEDQITNLPATENLSSPAPLMVQMQCPGFSIDLKLNAKPTETLNNSLNNLDTEILSPADISTIPLPDHLIHKMIEVYRKYPQLWNPNHLDFNSRTLRRQAWCSLTTEFNSAMGKRISWRTLHRKLTDYAKYYKKLITEQEDYERVENKWAFYEDFKFMDDVIAVNNELQRSILHRDSNFKIIDIYKTLPQLWNTQHPDYNKRGSKQRNIEIMCNKLQEENNLQLTTERLKNRLIELRAQYRTAKKQRLKCFKNKQTFSSNHFEYYEALDFLDDHIDPFTCDICKLEFKKRTDYKQHVKKEHSQKSGLKNHTIILPLDPDMENICHICGIKFSTRSNLRHHLRRHEGIRNYACSMCPKKFYASYALKVHIRSHTKECPYTCEKCGMSFVSASKLNQHTKRHLNKKDFQCDFCTKTFFTAFEKDRHERRHLNIRDKSCPVCGKTFVAGSSYYAHLMLHDDTKRFECDKCDMKFAQYAGLYKHRKRHHV